MSINLSKGNRVAYEGPTKFVAGLGWKANSTPEKPFDLDVVVFELNENDKLVSDNHLVFYNQLTDPESAVKHSGDNRTGDATGDDEKIFVDLAKLNPAVKKLLFIVDIHESEARRQNFGQVSDAYIRIFDETTGTESLKFDLSEDYSTVTAIRVAMFYLKDGAWKFQAIGEGEKQTLEYYVNLMK